MERNKVFNISFKGGTCCVDYQVTPEDGSPERNKVRKSDKLHGDFESLLCRIRNMAAEMLEIGLTNVDGSSLNIDIESIVFLEVELSGLANSYDDIFITTPAYYALGKYPRQAYDDEEIDEDGIIRMQQLSVEQVALIKQLKDEAFKFAYYGKKLQPTVEEAAEAAKSGGFKDEKEE